ncbi:glycoside hydrolase family 43 protein [Sphingomonas sp. PL-96]|uniref:glycoside hydrolase family 43 protein n=1 Tax=Sphingomonas sp. PL-96 TaxID=2887201 RepID=UPI001E4DBD9A|nr:glycoside hydrolase family 43 protein [Sphingomonas sp. PL-96]MCC2977842.1 glycoside hydrolase family 43 protein [Sphingomonas sp. PL-96]
MGKLRGMILPVLLLAAKVAPGAAALAAPTTATNPLLPGGPDPWIVREGDTFYYMATLGDRLAIRATRDLARLAEAKETVVWRPQASGPNAQSIWAPELHRIDGKWYIYYTAAAAGHDDDAHRGVFVLENAATDPLKGAWVDRGRVATARPGIDGTTFEHRGKRYFVYSPYVGSESDLAIVAMANPWTVTGPETILARPDRAWERQGGRQILEGPAFLKGPKGALFLSYSGSACWSDGYAVGLLRARADADPMKAASWKKAATPILKTTPSAGVFAPGHNGFFTAASGATWMVYHANTAAGMGCTGKRAPHIQRVSFDASGAPTLPRLEREAVVR